jgi:DNA repair protein RadD
VTITLREDQSAVVNETRDALREHQSVLIRAPCRFGKTVVAAFMAKSASERKKRVIFACHRDPILRQIAATFDQFGIKHGFIAAGRTGNPFAHAQVASADTLRNRLDCLKDCALLVVDECHLWNSKTRKLIIDAAKKAGAKVVGLSATPIRLDGKPLRDLFDHMVLGPSEAELIERGSLATYRVYAPVSADLTGIHTRAGDYAVSEVAERLDKPSIVGDAPATWKKYASGLRTVVYAINRAHGKHVLEAYLAAGIRAAYIDGETPKGEQVRIAHALADGGIDVLVSVELLTTGYDLGSLVGRNVTIQCVQLLRPTKSLQLAIQMMMRCMTAWEGVSIILDHVNMILNRDGTLNHGFPDDDRDWSLDGSTTNKQDGVTDVNVWLCETCFASVKSSKPVCPYCSKEHTVKPRVIDTEEGELQEIKRQQAIEKKARRIEVGRSRDLPSLADIAIDRKYKTGWLIKQAKAKGIHPCLPWKDACAAMMEAKQRTLKEAA